MVVGEVVRLVFLSLACISQKTRRLFVPEKLFYVQTVYHHRFNFH